MKKTGKIIAFAMTLVFLVSGCAKKNESVDNTVTKTNEPPVETEKRVSFFGAGDNLIHNCVYWQADSNAEGAEYDFKPMYERMAEDISSADIAYLNQETILGGTQLGLSSYPMFNSPQECGRDMIALGFDVFSHATNHVFDKGEAGIKNTYEFYESYPDAVCVGIYKKGEENIKLVERNGVKIAFVNYTYHTNGLSLSEDSEFYVPLADYENDCANMVETVRKADEMADFVVCCLHWGDENKTVPNEIQKESAKILSENGCDVIIGTHPHAIQPVEYVGDTLVVYSLGNFISAQATPVNLVGGTVSFDFVVKGEEKYVENVNFRPVINQYENRFSNIRIIPFDEYSEELAKAHGVEVSYDYFKNLIENTIDKQYLYSEKVQ